MKLAIRRHIPLQLLLEEIKRVPLKNLVDGKKIYPYEKAKIGLREFSPEELNPGSRYVLQSQLEIQRELRSTLLQDHGLDSLALHGGYELETSQGLLTLLPPIVEVSEETVCYEDTRGDIPYSHPVKAKINIIVDGLHRAYLSRLREQPLQVIHIFGIPDEYPFYALANQWDEIRILQRVPATMPEKKNYRRSDSYALYRDFDVLGCGKPRGVSTPETMENVPK